MKRLKKPAAWLTAIFLHSALQLGNLVMQRRNRWKQEGPSGGILFRECGCI